MRAWIWFDVKVEKGYSLIMSKIQSIKAYEILASGGLPTIECRVETEEGFVGVASVSYGASAGSHEASVLSDGDNSRYGGKGVLVGIKTIKDIIAPKLIGKSVFAQQKIDDTMIEMDGTPRKTNMGGNVILAVSMAVCRAGAMARHMELYDYLKKTFSLAETHTLPKPMVVTIEGGAHADNSTDFQEYLLSITHSTSPTENIRVASEIYQQAKKILKEKKLSTNVGNEGAFAPDGIENNTAPLDILKEAIERAGYKPGADAFLSIDCAASEFLQSDGKYFLKKEERVVDAEELLAFYKDLVTNYPILTIEDMFHEDAWADWTKIMVEMSGNVSIIGDDLTVTNVERVQKAIDKKAMNGLLVKLNQAGSVSETIAACILAKTNKFMLIPSHRGGGESNDTFLVDLAVAVGADFIKVGITRGERVVKYNRLMEIERNIDQTHHRK